MGALMFKNREEWKDVPSTRVDRWRKQFELTVDRVLGERVRMDGAAAVELWSALANIRWRHPEGEEMSYSSRAAGDFVAWVREEGDYIDWFCCDPIGVSPWIAEALEREGWTWHEYEHSG